MSFKEFKRKMKAVFPEKSIRFESNESGHAAHVEGLLFTGSPFSTLVSTYWESNGAYAGRAYTVEDA